MQLTVDNLSALRALRVFRREGRMLPAERHDLQEPDPSPQQRWTARVIPARRLGLSSAPGTDAPIEVAVPSAEKRLRGAIFSCTVRSTSIPRCSFVSLGDGLSIPCPELLFYELAGTMSQESLALVGYELCGTYARDPSDPRRGEVVYGAPPVTSVEQIRSYLAAFRDRPQAMLARLALRRVADNAWSPMEAIVALMIRLPVADSGYELGEVVLNVRHGATPELVALGGRGSRVPDIEVVGTHVGFNYDSHLHLDLESIALAAATGSAEAQIAAVRRKHHDDIKRNRELAAMGRVVLSVTSADLFAPGGLDSVMLQAAMTIDELDGGQALANAHAAITPAQREHRQRLIWSLLPWDEGVRFARELAAEQPWYFT